MIESMTLKRNIENKMLKNLNLDNQVHDNEGQGQRLPTNIGVPTDTVLRIWNYITFFIITTYSRGLKEESSYNGISKALKSGSSYEVDLKGESYYDADLKSESCYDAGLKGESCYKEELKSESSYKACSNMRDEASRIVKIFTQAYLEGSKHNTDERIHEIEFFFPSQEEEFSDCLEDIMSKISKTITEAPEKAFSNKVLMLNLLLKAVSFKPRPIHFILFVLVQLRRAIKDMHNLMQHIGVTLGAEGESKCVYNMMNLYLHFLILNGKIVLTKDERQLIAAVSALHPLQDDYIDKENLTREVLDIITFKLQGYEFNFSQGCKSNYLEKRFNGILKLIDIIYSHYPINHHPDLVYIFCELQRWQCKSLQQKVGCTLTELLQISFMKGGYAFALFGYIALGKMSPSQFGYFFSMGAIFQLLDDLKDYEMQNRF